MKNCKVFWGLFNNFKLENPPTPLLFSPIRQLKPYDTVHFFFIKINIYDLNFRIFKQSKPTSAIFPVSVILSDPPCKDGNALFTTVPLKACLIKYEIDIHVFVSLNC